jgi:hypothetical protein
MILLTAGLALAASAAWLVSCGPTGFADEALVNGVRILATRADLPYAKPGDTVTLSVLAVDGRTRAPGQEPMVVYWFPVALAPPFSRPLPPEDFVCEDPANDAYYACFSSLVALLGDAGAKVIAPGVDLSSFVPKGPTFSVPLSSDIITKHPPVQGTDPYGMAIVFNMACAGHPELLAPNSSDRSFNQVPIGCFDKNGNRLDSDSYVVGYTTIYAYDALTNANPVISHMVYQGNDMDGGFVGDSSTARVPFVDGDIAVDPCAETNTKDCPTYSFDLVVPSSSWEVDPQNHPNGQPLHEQIWVDYYWTTGTFSDDSRLVYDPAQGYVGKTAVSWTAPADAGPATFWAVVHDNRGGVAWDVVPFKVQ